MVKSARPQHPCRPTFKDDREDTRFTRTRALLYDMFLVGFDGFLRWGLQVCSSLRLQVLEYDIEQVG